MITGPQLRKRYLTAQMKFYLDRRLAPVSSQDVDIRVEELLKYLAMAAHCPGDIPVSYDIDTVWHLWILQTQEYQNLCAKLPGGVFLHHNSNDYTAFADPGIRDHRTDVQTGISVLASYAMNYGPFEKDRLRYWPLAERLVSRMNWDVPQLNDWLATPQRAAA